MNRPVAILAVLVVVIRAATTWGLASRMIRVSIPTVSRSSPSTAKLQIG
ncbi:MAG: hypothetical protein ACOCY7_03365 [Halodesulfurarchaeum sp.]